DNDPAAGLKVQRQNSAHGGLDGVLITVLVIDADAKHRETLTTLLKSRRFQVIDAPSGREGLKLVMNERPDLVIVDFSMPQMNGYEFVREIKSLFEFRK